MRGSVTTAALLLALGFSPVSASAAPEQKIATVDLEKALKASKEGQAAQKTLETDLQKAQQEIDKKKTDYEHKQADFSKQQESLSQAAKAEKREELIKMEQELRRAFADSQQNLRRKNGELMTELIGKMRKVIAEVGKADGYTVVLEKDSPAVLYADGATDVTDKVIARFNAAK